MILNTLHGVYCTPEDSAAHIVATVVSDAVAGKVVIDAESKTLTMDPCLTLPGGGHGYIVEHPEAKIERLSEEHGEVDITKSPRPPTVGQRVSIVPNHICPCVNLQDRVVLVEGDEWRELRVDTRGMLA